MENFDLSKEMADGKKHMCKLRYDIKKYKFIEYIEKLFESELNNLHNIQKQEYEVFTEVGKDSNTEFHKTFYKRLDEGWDIQDEYDAGYESCFQLVGDGREDYMLDYNPSSNIWS